MALYTIHDLAEFQTHLNEAAAALHELITQKMGADPWKSAFVDMRAFADDSGSIQKLGVELPDGTIERKLQPPIKVSDFFVCARRARDQIFPTTWFAMKIHVFPEGKCKVDFNYDPKCADDPTFFDD